ncbi:uncharacterized protein PHALS_08469 [Plasmopara halstedii]|uniref:RxLR-like protein n=1 Tax=Plasmopara halstedii TaxID=4781 RepID=A0A0P1ACL2_PLAHL|nr:uncharacterized protein PHALS_08469 [Plasmopara halstedii]CEG38391.1 hypothetical protein PHALS_08469 [Plasmopara halstedii]|eukprot:XP_024574760.1 hypothetical protein PHALS_08469 [Plasmopara halstedii]
MWSTVWEFQTLLTLVALLFSMEMTEGTSVLVNNVQFQTNEEMCLGCEQLATIKGVETNVKQVVLCVDKVRIEIYKSG